MAEITGFTRRLVIRGGPGSGHRKHKGVPGKRGGSAPTYPEGMAPSDQPKGKWRTLTDAQLAGPRPVPDEYMHDSKSERITEVAYNKRMSEWGKRAGVNLMGGRLPDATMNIIHEFYQDLVFKKDVDAFAFGRRYATELRKAAEGMGYGVLNDTERGFMRETAQYINDLVDPAAWSDWENIGTGDEEVQEYILQEIVSTMKPFSDFMFLSDGSRNKTKVDKFLSQSIGEDYDNMMDRLSAGMSEYHSLTHQESADQPEVMVEKSLMGRADVIDAAFVYAETEGEKLRQRLVESSVGTGEIERLTLATKEAQAKSDETHKAFQAKREELNAQLESSEAHKAARAELDREYDESPMTPEERNAVEFRRREAYLKISKMDREMDDALHNSSEWFKMAEAQDDVTTAHHDLERAKFDATEAARQFIEANAFGSPATKIAGEVVRRGGRGMSAKDVEIAAGRNRECREWVADMVASDVIADGVPLNYENKRTSRGSQWGTGYNLSPGSEVQDHLHETGHWLEEHNENLHAQAVAFLRYRNQGEDYVRMSAARKRTQAKRKAAGLSTSHLYSRGFKASEIAASDAWRDPYAGKKYGRDYYATEVLSMGLQWLYSDPVNFAIEDPEHFNYTIAMIAGAK